eukprot:8351786-Ditylum_brightwellii.AAC.2
MQERQDWLCLRFVNSITLARKRPCYPFSACYIKKISSNLTKARKELCKAQKNAAELHNEYMEETAQLKITHSNTGIATIIKNKNTERK